MRKLRNPGPGFPYTDPTVPFMAYLDGEYRYACTVTEKTELLSAIQLSPKVTGNATIYAVWPGKKRSDAFRIQLVAAMTAMVAAGGVPFAPPSQSTPVFPRAIPPGAVVEKQKNPGVENAKSISVPPDNAVPMVPPPLEQQALPPGTMPVPISPKMRRESAPGPPPQTYPTQPPLPVQKMKSTITPKKAK